MKEIAFLAIHGMGKTDRNYAEKDSRSLFPRLRSRLGRLAEHVAFESIYYQDILQDNEDRVFLETKKRARIDWLQLREFLLYGFGDAAGLENRKEVDGSCYEHAQLNIAKALLSVLDQLGDPNKPVIITSHSLGCHVLSSYIWDAQKSREHKASVGIWKYGDFAARFEKDLGPLTPEKIEFLRLPTLLRLYTVGCNIPIFVAAHVQDEIVPFSPPGRADFRWLNFYDADDVLGWPLAVLSEKYAQAVTDVEVNAGRILVNWTPFSHNEYWGDSEVLDPMVNAIIDNL